MIRTAHISDDGLYRYRLGRAWDSDRPVMVWVMLNPSTADADVDDPTIRRCISFAERAGCGAIDVVNLFSFRSTHPNNLLHHRYAGGDLCGPLHRDVFRSAINNADVSHVVAAWGAHPAARFAGERFILPAGTMCLGLTKSGAPRHPLYVKGDTPFEPWRAV